MDRVRDWKIAHHHHVRREYHVKEYHQLMKWSAEDQHL